MPEHGNKRSPDQASQGATAWFSGAGSQPGLCKTTADRVKINHARIERPCDPDDAITWQSSAE